MAPRTQSFKSIEPPRSSERQLSQVLLRMVSEMSDEYVKRTIEKIGPRTAAQFEDGAPKNYAVKFTSLAESASAFLLNKYNDDMILKIVRQILRRADKQNLRTFSKSLEKFATIDVKERLTGAAIENTIEALEVETAQWVKKLRDETLELYTSNTLRAMTQGQSIESVLDAFRGLEEKRKNHAKMTARTQIANYNSLVGRARAESVGITEAEWVTSRDERVRECHRVRDKKRFDLKKGLYSSCDRKWLLPGVDYQCRCVYRFVIPDEGI